MKINKNNVLKNLKIFRDKKEVIIYLPYIATLVFCFFVFQQGDIFHTSSSSYAYLEGHFTDFYDYNKPFTGKNDYYALMYIIFAIWNIPLKIMQIAHDVPTQGLILKPIELFWTKLLLVVFFFLTGLVIYKITKLITDNKLKCKKIACIFITSPIAVFAVFIFGQYDIIGLFFTMLGIYFYIKKDYLRFSIAFSISISLKFFPLIIFIPLILLSHKKILSIIKYTMIGLLATLIQILMYVNNEAFKENMFSLASGKINSLKILQLSDINNAPYLIIVFFIICIYAYIKEIKSDAIRNRCTIFLCLISYATLFSTIVWHPQWLILITPFFALSYLYIKDFKKMYIIDIVGMASYVYIVVNMWANHVDVSMVKMGILREIFDYIPLINSDIFINKYLYYFEAIFFVYLFSPILVYYFSKNHNDKNEFIIRTYDFYPRFYIGIGVFILPSIFCLYAPKQVAQKINPNAYTTQVAIVEDKKSIVPIGPIVSECNVIQSFFATSDLLKEIDIKVSTFNRVNKCNATLLLYDEKMSVIEKQKINCETLKDNEFYKFKFSPIKNSLGNKYYLEIRTDGDFNNNIVVWATEYDEYSEGELLLNQQIVDGDLNMKVFYDIVE